MMSKPLHSPVLILLAALLVAASAHANTARGIPIAEARSLPLGSPVIVEGSVTTPPGAFESSFTDKGFGLQDETAGIYVSVQAALEVEVGRRVRVTGTLQERSGLLILVPASASGIQVLHGKGRLVRPEPIGTKAVGESTEGQLVQIAGTITRPPTNDLPYGYKLFVDDGSGEVQVFINLQTGIDPGGLAKGQKLRVTGFSSQFDDHYEIDPRSQADIEFIRR